MATRALISRLSALSLSPAFSPFSSTFARSLTVPRSSPLFRLRPLVSFAAPRRLPVDISPRVGLRCFSSQPTTSSLNDQSPNWSNRPPKEVILLDGCDFEHWLVVMDPPDPSLTRDEIIDSYIKTLAQVLESEEEARMKIYSVSTKHYFAFGALVSEELSYKIKALPRVRWVLPDSYLDVKNKDYGGEPFINGQAVPYDPKYHEEWVRNNARANERSRRNDRPRASDRSRNFERRRENMQNRDMQFRDGPPMTSQNRDVPPPMASQNRDGPSPSMPPRDMPPPQNAMPNYNTMPPRSPSPPSTEYDMANQGYQSQMPKPQNSYVPNREGSYQGGPGYQGGNPGYQGGGPGYQGGNPGHQGGNPGYQGVAPAQHGGGGPRYQDGGPGYQGSGYQGGGGPGYQGGSSPGYQSGGPGYQGGGSPGYQSGGGPGYQGGSGSPGYQGGGGGSPGYQGGGGGPGYQGGGGSPGYQGGGGGPGYQGGGGYNEGSGPGYQGREMPGRD